MDIRKLYDIISDNPPESIWHKVLTDMVWNENFCRILLTGINFTEIGTGFEEAPITMMRLPLFRIFYSLYKENVIIIVQ